MKQRFASGILFQCFKASSVLKKKSFLGVAFSSPEMCISLTDSRSVCGCAFMCR